MVLHSAARLSKNTPTQSTQTRPHARTHARPRRKMVWCGGAAWRPRPLPPLLSESFLAAPNTHHMTSRFTRKKTSSPSTTTGESGETQGDDQTTQGNPTTAYHTVKIFTRTHPHTHSLGGPGYKSSRFLCPQRLPSVHWSTG